MKLKMQISDTEPWNVIIVEGDGKEIAGTRETQEPSRCCSILTKLLFFLIGSSVTCQGSVGWLTSKTFGTETFIGDCFGIFFGVNLVAFIFVLLFIEGSYKKAVVCGWVCVMCHTTYIVISIFGYGNVAKHLYIAVYGTIGALEAIIMQSSKF